MTWRLTRGSGSPGQDLLVGVPEDHLDVDLMVA